MKHNTINIDWLQFSVTGEIPQEFQLKQNKNIREIQEREFGESDRRLAQKWKQQSLFKASGYNFKLMGSTPQFKEWYKVTRNGHLMFDVLAKPHSVIIKENTINIRVYNDLLYSCELWNEIRDIMCAFEWQYKSMTRVDICMDSQSNYIDEFCRGFFEGKIITERNCSFSIFGKKNKRPVEIETISVNNPSSPISFKMYDKTAEMLAKGHKQWITDIWQLAGFDMDKKVIRMEVSLKKKCQFINGDEIEDIFFLENAENMAKVYWAAIDNFKFKKRNDKNELEKVFNPEGFILFDVKIHRKYSSSKSVRQTKYIANQILSFVQMKSDQLSKKEKEGAISFVSHFVSECSMVDKKMLQLSEREVQKLKEEIRSYYHFEGCRFM